MATFRITAPDGSKWEVNAPDGASEDAVMRYAMAQYKHKPKAEKFDPTLLNRAAAGASGFNAGALAGIPGLPVDTALNVADLARAAYGYVGGKMGMKPENMPELLNREDYLGSSANIRKGIRKAGGSVLIDNPRPDDAASRVLHLTGMSMVGAKTPAQFGAGATAGGAMGVAGEMGFGPEGQILASMLPQAASLAARGGTRAAIAGGEKTRRQMAENLKTMRDAGVENPSAGVIGPRQAGGLENFGARYPGASGVMVENARKLQSDLSAKLRQIADDTSTNRGDAATGQATQQDITGRWKPKFDDLYERLDSRVEQKVGGGRVPIDNTLETSGLIASGVPGAPHISKMLLGGSGIPKMDAAIRRDANIPIDAIRATIPQLEQNLVRAQSRYNQLVQESGIAQAFANDATYRGNNWTPVPGQPRVGPRASNFPDRAAEGQSAFQEISSLMPEKRAQIAQAASSVEQAQAALAAAKPSIPYPALRGVGSMIGKEAGDNLLHGNAETGRYKQVYGAIAQDKANAAAQAGAGRELARANAFYSKGADKMDQVLSPFTKEGVAPEQAYQQFRSMVLSSPSKAHALRKSLSEDVRRMQTSTLVDELGQATPGRQNAEGSLFSSETFLTNWNKISPDSKAVIFSGFKDAGKIRTQMESVAKAAELIRTKGGIYSNPSGTAQAGIQAGVIGTGVVAAATGNISLLATVLGSVAGANITARMMTNPRFVSWLAESKSLARPEAAQAHIRRLAIVANGMDAETRGDLEKFAASLAE